MGGVSYIFFDSFIDVNGYTVNTLLPLVHFILLLGHSTLIGSRTGQVLGYAIRCKSCRVCEHAKRKKQTPRKHQCSQNWTGV